MNMRIGSPIAAVAALALAAASPLLALAGAAPEEAASMLYERGYRHIQIEPDSRPGYRAYACKGNTHFRVRINRANNIVDVDPVGECSPKKGPKKVHVRAPFTDVQVGGGGVRVRAPFVDIKIR